MALKYVKKKKLEFKNGYFFLDGDIVAIDLDVVRQLNELELAQQKCEYIICQPKAQPAPSLEGFERESIVTRPQLFPQTPALEEAYERAKKIMDDVDAVQLAKEVNDLYAQYDELIQWVNSKKVFVNTEPCSRPMIVDTPHLGNPLSYSADEICELIFNIKDKEVHLDD